jgi:hypothetical protein
MPAIEQPAERQRNRWLLGILLPAIITMAGSAVGGWVSAYYALGKTQTEHGIRLNSLEALQAREAATLRRELDSLAARLATVEGANDKKLAALSASVESKLTDLGNKLDRLLWHMARRGLEPSDGGW